MECAETLAIGGKVQLFRAGVWKPRTRPGSFEGVGNKALAWLKKAENEFGIPAIIEVAREGHVAQALDAGIGHFWIGARTTVNPFSVQEIAEALKGNDVPVLIKNPLNPDLELWIGAIERFLNVGIRKIAAVHRGFNTYQDHVFRNSPNWEIPIALKTRMPQLEVIVDPSHIAGKRELVRDVAQKALDMAFDGLMIETHPNPKVALSDNAQQIVLSDFHAFMADLENRKLHFADAVSIDKLQRLRSLIDEIDHNLIENLKRRLEVVDEIGLYKAEAGVAVFQLERWRQILADRKSLAQELHIDELLVMTIWDAIHVASLKRQTEIAGNLDLDKEV